MTQFEQQTRQSDVIQETYIRVPVPGFTCTAVVYIYTISPQISARNYTPGAYVRTPTNSNCCMHSTYASS